MPVDALIEKKLRSLLDAIYDEPIVRIKVVNDPNIGYKANISSSEPDFLKHLIGKNGQNLNYIRGIMKIIEKKHGFRVSIWVERNATNI